MINSPYTEEQIKQIRATLHATMGNTLDGALDKLVARLDAKGGGEDTEETILNRPLPSQEEEEEETQKLDLDAIIQSGNVAKLLLSLKKIKGDLETCDRIVDALLAHPKGKSFQLVDALEKTFHHPSILEKIVDGLVTRKGVTPLIEALKYTETSPSSATKLATAICHNGTVNHLIRSLATLPSGLSGAEIVLAMEIIARGGVQQILEACKLLSHHSPGIIVLATGLTNRQDPTIEPLVRALNAVSENHVASAILATKLAQISDPKSLVALLAKHLSDETSAGEILTCQLVYHCLQKEGGTKLMAKAARYMRQDSLSGNILAMGIVKQGNEKQMERAYNRMKSHPMGQKIVAAGIVKKLGKIKAIKILGRKIFKISGDEKSTKKAHKEALTQYEMILKGDLKLNPSSSAG
ncbi:MAG: hypothetical protein HQL72_00690 [Magnetococcales bacterium]|nr:hypothetical protein [Magnetococcales bacterium]